MSDEYESVWDGASSLTTWLERDYKAMQVDDWDVIYVPPSPPAQMWSGRLSDTRLLLRWLQKQYDFGVLHHEGHAYVREGPKGMLEQDADRILEADRMPENTTVTKQLWPARRLRAVVDVLKALEGLV